MTELQSQTVVVGSGCAGLNAADWLADLGQDVTLLTEDMNAGTSRNTGSDKQTYYKLSLAGGEGDSVSAMAETLHGDDVDGDLALCEAAGSAQCFFKLVQLGVPFPMNEYGEYPGYRTDHDQRNRASSAGPLTSRFMTEALERSVRRRHVRVLDHHFAFRVITDDCGVQGVLALDTRRRRVVLIRCANVILATGGMAGVYRRRVYPESQWGMSGMAFRAGAKGANLQCWQYGLASLAFRWNVSGSYQQVMPRYVSVAPDGAEYDFLNDAMPTAEMLHAVFLKGYEWPFDPGKTNGSSRVDLLVKEQEDLGRRVYLDFRQNPAGYDKRLLSDDCRGYLAGCGALLPTPIERLGAMNAPAAALYRSHGIALERDRLEIGMCAQHHNGGIEVDEHWQTCVPGLFVCGEAAGTFGRRRPGGAALNSTQVGSMRAAIYIARHGRALSKTPAELPERLMLPGGDPQAMLSDLQGRMTRFASFVRDREGMREHLSVLEQLDSRRVPYELTGELPLPLLRLDDIMTAQREILSAMLARLESDEPGVMETDRGVSRLRPARPLPDRDLWFEHVWARDRAERKMMGK